MTELGFEENTKEKGKMIMEDSDQQTTSHKKPIQTVEEEGKNTTEKPIQEGLCPEASCTNENPEKLSVMLKNIASKSEICNQLLKTENKDMKPRTKLRKKLETEKRSAHEDAMEIVMIDDALSEETVHTSKDQYCADIERFIDIQGVTGSIPESFCTNKQVNSDDGSASKTLQGRRSPYKRRRLGNSSRTKPS